MKKLLIAVAAAAISAAVYALGPSMYSAPTYSQMERAIAAAKGEGYPVNTPSLYSEPTYSQMERLITAIGKGGGGADTNSVRTIIDSSFDGGIQKVNRVVGSFDNVSNRVVGVEAKAEGLSDRFTVIANRVGAIEDKEDWWDDHVDTNSFNSATNELWSAVSDPVTRVWSADMSEFTEQNGGISRMVKDYEGGYVTSYTTNITTGAITDRRMLYYDRNPQWGKYYWTNGTDKVVYTKSNGGINIVLSGMSYSAQGIPDIDPTVDYADIGLNTVVTNQWQKDTPYVVTFHPQSPERHPEVYDRFLRVSEYHPVAEMTTNAVEDIVSSSAVTNIGAVVSGNDAEHGTLYRRAEALYDDGMRTVTIKMSPEEYYMGTNGRLEKVSVPHGYGYNFSTLVFSDGVGPFDITITYAGINDMSSLQCTPHEYHEGLLISSCRNGLTFAYQFDMGYEGDVAHMHTKYAKVTNPIGYYKSYVIAPDGTNYYYYAGDNNGSLYHGTLSSPWDILSSVSKVTSVPLSTRTTCMRVSPDGTRLFYKGFGTSEMYTALMSTPFDIETITNTVTTSISSVIPGNWYGFCISSDGSYVLLCGTDGLLAKCKLATPWDMSTMTLVQTANTGLKYLRAVDVDEESDMLLVSASALSSAVSPSDVKLYSAKLSGLPKCEVFASKPYVDAVRSDIDSMRTGIADAAKVQTNYTDKAVKYDVQKVWAQDGSYLHNATGELFSVEVVPMGGVWYFTGMYKSTGLQVTDLPLYYSSSSGYRHSWTNKVGNIGIGLQYSSDTGTYFTGGYQLVEGLPKNLDPRAKGVVLPDFVQPTHQLWSNVKGEFKAMGSGAPSQTPYDRFATVSELSSLIRKNELENKFYDLSSDGEFRRMCVDIARTLGATVTNDVGAVAQP